MHHCVVHIHVACLDLVVVGYVEAYCTPDDGLGQLNVCLSSIALLDRHIVQAIFFG